MDIHYATIVVDDNQVLLNREGYEVDVRRLLENDIHAVQWYGDEGFGEVEFRSHFLKNEDPPRWDRKPNLIIKAFDEDAWVIPLGQEAKVEFERKREEERVRMEAMMESIGKATESS